MTLKEQIFESLSIKDETEVEGWRNATYSCDKNVSDKFLDLCKDSEKIIILGDYDVDGIHATFEAETGLKEIFPDKEFECLIPTRAEGYGLNQRLEDHCIEAAKNSKVTVITVDTGITAKDRLEKMKEAGCTVILTDHHKLDDESALPNVDLVIDPALSYLECPFGEDNRNLCGAGVIFKILENYLSLETRERLNIYAGIATIADVISLRGISWQIVRRSLDLLHEGKGDKAITRLAEALGKDLDYISESDFGFYLCPAINAPGRILTDEEIPIIKDYVTKAAAEKFEASYPTLIQDEGAMFVLNYYRQPSESQATNLKYINEYRKELVERETQIIIDKIEEENKGDCNPIWAYAPGLHKGIVGIIASAVEEKYKTSACILTDAGNGLLSGSGRAYGNFNMYEYLNDHKDEFYKFGGHPGAAGFALLEENYHDMELFVTPKSDIIVETPEPIKILPDFIPYIEYITTPLRPFGEGFREPEYITAVTQNLMKNNSNYVGSNKDHLTIKSADPKTKKKYKMMHFFHRNPEIDIEVDTHKEDPFVGVGEVHMSYFKFKDKQTGELVTIQTPEMTIKEIEEPEEEMER